MWRSVQIRTIGLIALGWATLWIPRIALSQEGGTQDSGMFGDLDNGPAPGGATDSTADATAEEAGASADMEASILAGDEALTQKRWRQALAAYMQVEPEMRDASADPDQSLRLYIGLAEAYRGLKQWENALRYAVNAQLRAGQKDAATQAREYARVGEIMLKIGEDPSEAIDQLKFASSIDPNNPEYLFQVGKGLAEFARQQASNQVSDGLEEMRDALKQLDAAVELRDDHAESYYERGSVNLALGNVEHGVKDLQKAVEYDANNSKFLAELGQTLQSRAARDAEDPEGITSKILADYRQSIDLFDRYVDIEGPKEAARKATQSREIDDELPLKLKDVLLMRAKSRSAFAHEMKGEVATEQFQQVITDCRKATELDPEDVFLRARAAYHTAIAESMLGHMEAALAEFNRAIRTPQNALSRSLASEGTPPSDAVVRRGIVWYRLGDREMAFRDFQEAAEVSDTRGHFWQGIVHAEREEFSRAIDAYSDAIRLRPDYISAYKNRGLAYMHLGLYRRAADDFEELIRRNPNDKESYRRREVAFEKLGIHKGGTSRVSLGMAGNGPRWPTTN